MFNKIYNFLKSKQESGKVNSVYSGDDVREFYNSNTDKFIEVYGEVIQAFRTKDVKDYLNYTIKNAELNDGQKILDAGCGVGGPAGHFASHLQVDIKGLTISEYQVAKSREILSGKTLKGTIEISQGDYHQIDSIYGKDVFDRVLFLESFGHSNNQTLLIEKAYHVLQPGGILYIKDLFKREYPNKEDGEKIERIINAINHSYKYNVADFSEIMRSIRKLGFILLSVKTPEVVSEQFEHLTISNDFQNLFDIGKIISWEDYVFPVDFYEIKVMKPPFDISKDKHLYFLNRPTPFS